MSSAKQVMIENQVKIDPNEERWIKALPQEVGKPAMCAVMRDEHKFILVEREYITRLRKHVSAGSSESGNLFGDQDVLRIVEEHEVEAFMKEKGLPKNSGEKSAKEEVEQENSPDERYPRILSSDLDDDDSESEDRRPLAPWEIEEEEQEIKRREKADKEKKTEDDEAVPSHLKKVAEKPETVVIFGRLDSRRQKITPKDMAIEYYDIIVNHDGRVPKPREKVDEKSEDVEKSGQAFDDGEAEEESEEDFEQIIGEELEDSETGVDDGQELKEKLTQEQREKIKMELKEEIRKELRKELKRDLKRRVREEVEKEMLKKEVKDLKNELEILRNQQATGPST